MLATRWALARTILLLGTSFPISDAEAQAAQAAGEQLPVRIALRRGSGIPPDALPELTELATRLLELELFRTPTLRAQASQSLAACAPIVLVRPEGREPADALHSGAQRPAEAFFTVEGTIEYRRTEAQLDYTVHWCSGRKDSLLLTERRTVAYHSAVDELVGSIQLARSAMTSVLPRQAIRVRTVHWRETAPEVGDTIATMLPTLLAHRFVETIAGSDEYALSDDSAAAVVEATVELLAGQRWRGAVILTRSGDTADTVSWIGSAQAVDEFVADGGEALLTALRSRVGRYVVVAMGNGRPEDAISAAAAALCIGREPSCTPDSREAERVLLLNFGTTVAREQPREIQLLLGIAASYNPDNDTALGTLLRALDSTKNEHAAEDERHRDVEYAARRVAAEVLTRRSDYGAALHQLDGIPRVADQGGLSATRVRLLHLAGRDLDALELAAASLGTAADTAIVNETVSAIRTIDVRRARELLPVMKRVCVAHPTIRAECSHSLYSRGVRAIERGQYDDGRAMLRAVQGLASAPDTIQAWVAAYTAWSYLGSATVQPLGGRINRRVAGFKPDEANTALIEAEQYAGRSRSVPFRRTVRGLRTVYWLNADRPREAVVSAEAALQTGSDDLRAQVLAGEAYMLLAAALNDSARRAADPRDAARLRSEAVRAYRTAARRFAGAAGASRDPLVYRFLVEASHSGGETDKVRRLFETAIARDSSNQQAYVMLGNVCADYLIDVKCALDARRSAMQRGWSRTAVDTLNAVEAALLHGGSALAEASVWLELSIPGLGEPCYLTIAHFFRTWLADADGREVASKRWREAFERTKATERRVCWSLTGLVAHLSAMPEHETRLLREMVHEMKAAGIVVFEES